MITNDMKISKLLSLILAIISMLEQHNRAVLSLRPEVGETFLSDQCMCRTCTTVGTKNLEEWFVLHFKKCSLPPHGEYFKKSKNVWLRSSGILSALFTAMSMYHSSNDFSFMQRIQQFLSLSKSTKNEFVNILITLMFSELYSKEERIHTDSQSV